MSISESERIDADVATPAAATKTLSFPRIITSTVVPKGNLLSHKNLPDEDLLSDSIDGFIVDGNFQKNRYCFPDLQSLYIDSENRGRDLKNWKASSVIKNVFIPERQLQPLLT